MPVALCRLWKKKSLKNIVFSRLFTFGGDKRDRTADLLNAIQALSQAVRVHTPVIGAWKMRFNTQHFFIKLTMHHQKDQKLISSWTNHPKSVEVIWRLNMQRMYEYLFRSVLYPHQQSLERFLRQSTSSLEY